ncbi:MAG: hypothetical protein KIS92_11740 [Planctomycetota bacterium]|nr:hypothetical protein [Planctomycetota bacterium]
MEVLIELIVWIFRTLFGEQEPPAKLGPRGRSSDDDEDDRRGPYNYGDGRPAAGQPKTLAELLEEARRQSGGGRSVSPPPQVRPPEPRPLARPAPVPQPPPAIEAPAPVFQPLSVPAPVLFTPLASAQPTAQVQPQGQGRKNRKRKGAHPPPAASAMPAMPMPMARPAPRRVGLNTGPRTERARQLMPLFAALKKSRTNPGLLAAQAMVLKEVFGPPRALDPHRRGPMPR